MTPWLTASRAALLQACAARWLHESSSRDRFAQPDHSRNLGTVIHAVVEHWIQTGSWREPAGDQALQQRVVDLAAQESIAAADAVRAGARLALRAQGLREVMLANAGSPRTEVDFVSEAHRVRGRADLVMSGDPQDLVVDLKTGNVVREAAGIRTQMAVYAWLVSTSGRPWPETTVFSLGKGAHRLLLDEAEGVALVDNLLQLREEAMTNASESPTPDACFVCQRRLVCRAYWEATVDQRGEIALSGTLEVDEESALGPRTWVLKVDGTDVLIRGIERATVIGALTIGEEAKVAGVRARDGDNRYLAGFGTLAGSDR